MHSVGGDGGEALESGRHGLDHRVHPVGVEQRHRAAVREAGQDDLLRLGQPELRQLGDALLQDAQPLEVQRARAAVDGRELRAGVAADSVDRGVRQ